MLEQAIRNFVSFAAVGDFRSAERWLDIAFKLAAPEPSRR
jgi:hypothetical protein